MFYFITLNHLHVNLLNTKYSLFSVQMNHYELLSENISYNNSNKIPQFAIILFANKVQGFSMRSKNLLDYSISILLFLLAYAYSK